MILSKKLRRTAIAAVFRFSHEYYQFVISDYIFKSGKSSLSEIKQHLIKINLENSFGLDKITNENLIFHKNNFKISKSARKMHSSFYNFKKRDVRLSDHKIFEKISLLKDDYLKPISNQLSYSFLLNQYEPISEEDYYFIHFIMYFIFSNREDLQRRIDNLIDSIDDYLEHNLFQFISDESSINYFSSLGIISTKDLKQVSPNLVILILNIEILTFTKVFMSNMDTAYTKALDKINEITQKVKNWDIVKKSFDYRRTSANTLESIGQHLNVTRQRVLQIINKAQIDFKNSSNKHYFLIDAYLRFLMHNKVFYHIDNLKVDDNFLAALLNFIELQDNYQFDYDRGLKIIYKASETDISELENRYLDRMDFIYSKDLVFQNSITSKHEIKLLQSLIIKYYRKVHNVFLRRGYIIKDVILKAIDENYTEGYNISNDNDFNKLKSILKSIYGLTLEDFNSRRISTLFSNSNYALVDKSTYLNPKFLPKLDFQMIKEIERFIIENGPAVYYRSVYTEFNESFKKYGVCNHYHVKGIIDYEFNGQFLTKRDYIATEKGTTPSTAIKDFVLAQNNVITIGQIKTKFKGVKDYVINQIIDKREDIIKLSNSRYLPRSSIELNEIVLEKIYTYIDSIMDEIGIDTISISKLYARLKLNDTFPFDKYDYILNEFDLYQVLKQCYPSSYHYENNYISKSKNENTYFDLILKYFIDTKEINKVKVDAFLLKMNLRPISNYLTLIEKLKKHFIQVNVDTLVNVEHFIINDNQLDKIKWNLDLLSKKTDSILLSKISRFHTFPQLDYQWNEYLLAGVIRTYLNGYFELENTFNQYNKTKFILKRGERYGRD